jgi:ATP adenylyltransferase
MSDFVNADNTKHRPDGKYGKVIDQIKNDGVCPFCPENFMKYHKNPIIHDGNYWVLTSNMYPYEGAKHHALLVHKKHITTLAEVSDNAWLELKHVFDWYVREHNIPGGSFVMRFGDTRYTGASVQHLHANLVSSDGENPERKPILARIG